MAAGVVGYATLIFAAMAGIGSLIRTNQNPESFYATNDEGWTDPVEDLSE